MEGLPVAWKSQTAQERQKDVQSPQAHLSDTGMGVLVALQRQGSTTQKVHRSVESPKVHFQRHITHHSKHTDRVEVPRVQCTDKMVDGPAIMQRRVSITQDPCRAAVGYENSEELNEAAEPMEQIEHGKKKENGFPEPPEADVESCSAGCSENTDGPDLVVPSSAILAQAIFVQEESCAFWICSLVTTGDAMSKMDFRRGSLSSVVATVVARSTSTVSAMASISTQSVSRRPSGSRSEEGQREGFWSSQGC